ncbi:MAG: PDZ domain-containing protein [Planctomycetota bacterium]
MNRLLFRTAMISSLLVAQAFAQEAGSDIVNPVTTRPPLTVKFEIDGTPLTLRIEGRSVTLENDSASERGSYQAKTTHDPNGRRSTTRILDDIGNPVAQINSDAYGADVRFVARSRRPWIGIDLQPAPAVLVDQLGLELEKVSIVAGVRNNSPAAKGDLRVNDVIVAVDGKSVASVDEVQRVIAAHQPGDTLTLTVLRKGEPTELSLMVGRALLAGPLPPNTSQLAEYYFARAKDYNFYRDPRTTDALERLFAATPRPADVASSAETSPTARATDEESTPSTTRSDRRIGDIEERLTRIESLLERLTKDRKDH